MTRETFIALVTEEGVDRTEAERLWEVTVDTFDERAEKAGLRTRVETLDATAVRTAAKFWAMVCARAHEGKKRKKNGEEAGK